MNKKKLTIKDIGDLSGVSVRTVSRVINNHPSVSKKTREKVQNILDETNFNVNIFAKNLRVKSIYHIVVSVENQNTQFIGQWYMNLFQKLNKYAKKYKYKLILHQDDPSDDNSKSIYNEGIADGLLQLNTRINPNNYQNTGFDFIPTVTLGKTDSEEKIPYVDIDNYDAIYNAVAYLRNLGCEYIQFYLGSLDYSNNVERLQGFVDSTKNLDIRNQVVTNIRTFQEAYEHTMDIPADSIPDGVIVSGDEKALGVIRAFHKRDISMPADVKIIGLDGIPISEYYTPSLTTINQNSDEIANAMIEILHNILEGRPTESKIIKSDFIIRETTE